MVSIGDEPVLVPVFGDELDESQPVFDALQRDLLVNNDAFGFPAAAFLEALDQGVVFKCRPPWQLSSLRWLPPSLLSTPAAKLIIQFGDNCRQVNYPLRDQRFSPTLCGSIPDRSPHGKKEHTDDRNQ